MISPAPIDQADLIAGYKRASSIKPIKQQDLNKVYDEYSLKAGETSGKSDLQLQQRASKAVVEWWQKQQIAKAKAPVTGSNPGAPGGAPRVGAPGTSSPTIKPAPTTSAGLREGGTAGAPPAPVVQPRTFPALTSNTTKPLTPSQVSSMLKAGGMDGSVVPAYATTSPQALTAWISRTKYNRNLLAKRLPVRNL